MKPSAIIPLSPRKKRILSLALLLYLAGAMALYFFQDRLLFRAQPLAADYRFSSSLRHQEIRVAVNNSDTLHAVRYESQTTDAKGIVLYFHGNRNNITWYERFVPYFTQAGYEVLMMDYPGYGKSIGVRTEEKLYEWADLVYRMARKRYASDSIVVYGKSLGTGVAARLAALRDCKALVLETPYYDFPAVLQHYLFFYPVRQLLRYQLPTYRYLPQVTAPITILHGSSDELVSYNNALRLQKLFKKKDRLVTIPGGSHNDLFDYPATRTAIRQILTIRPTAIPYRRP